MCDTAPMGQRRRGVAIASPIATAADRDADIVWLMCDTESLYESLMAFETRHPPWRNIRRVNSPWLKETFPVPDKSGTPSPCRRGLVG
jgi:hypothetical protein